VTASIAIPDGYSCNTASVLGCWVRVRFQYPGGVTDTTTWNAEIVGDPVRLIE
jgi:hypothetical protein